MYVENDRNKIEYNVDLEKHEKNSQFTQKEIEK